jgi:hypothetical protein
LQTLVYAQAVHAREHNVEQNKIRMLVSRLFKSRWPAVGLKHGKAFTI